MTIEETIEQLDSVIDTYEILLGNGVNSDILDVDDLEAIKVAIASLEAWNEIKQEINDLFNKPAYYMPNYDAYKMFLEIIDKHLQKTSETETWNGYHGQITAPKGTFERIISDTDDEDDI